MYATYEDAQEDNTYQIPNRDAGYDFGQDDTFGDVPDITTLYESRNQEMENDVGGINGEDR